MQFEVRKLRWVTVLHFVRHHLVAFDGHFVGNAGFADLFGCRSDPFVPHRCHDVVFAVSTCSFFPYILPQKHSNSQSLDWPGFPT